MRDRSVAVREIAVAKTFTTEHTKDTKGGKELSHGWQARMDQKMGFAAAKDSPIVRSMESPDTALEEARRAGIDLDLLDSNLALTYEQRVLRHESALELVRALKEAKATREKPAASPPKAR